jgi:hypothetical protein
MTHEQKVARVADQLKRRTATTPVSLKKKAVSHEVPKLGDKRVHDEKIDVSDLDEILSIDPEKRVCIAEPGVTFVDLVDATLKHGLVPIVVPELKTITIGGAVAGCSIESMSYKEGGFHDTCLEYEVITAKGDVLVVTPDNEHKLVFQMMHGTFGTLGIIAKLTFRLVPAKKYVHVVYEKHPDLESYKASIWKHFKEKDCDFMDGIIHSPTELVLSVGNFTDTAPYAHRYDWMRIYYLSTRERKEDYLETPHYFFRYDKGVTNVTPRSFLGRLLLGKFVDSSVVLRFADKFRKYLKPGMIPVTLDTFIPFSKMTEFFGWYRKEVDFFPLWCVPYKKVRAYEWIDDAFAAKAAGDELFLDVAIYGLRRNDGKNYYRIIEGELAQIGAIKTLITPNYYTEEAFWKIWNKPNFDAVKKVTDPDDIFRGLYEKMCRATMGL